MICYVTPTDSGLFWAKARAPAGLRLRARASVNNVARHGLSFTPHVG